MKLITEKGKGLTGACDLLLNDTICETIIFYVLHVYTCNIQSLYSITNQHMNKNQSVN